MVLRFNVVQTALNTYLLSNTVKNPSAEYVQCTRCLVGMRFLTFT
jgi:hypothetical protein